MGWCALEIGRYDDAATAFSRTVGLDPENGEAWNNLAAAHLAVDRLPQALAALEQSAKIKRESWKVWDQILMCLMLLMCV